MHTAQTSRLLKLYLRRDRLKIVLWWLGLVGLMAGAAAKFDGLYGSPQAMASIVTTLKTPAMVSLLGPFTAKAPFSVADVYAAEMMVFMGLFVALMNIYFGVHNSRADEDAGMSELIRAHAVGQQASLWASLLELMLINLFAGILEALGLQAASMSGSHPAGNWLFGLGLAAFGFMFGLFTLLVAQISASSRGATMLSYLLLGILFIARMGTDVQNPNYTWWTVYGWIEKLAIYDQNNWLPVIYMLLLTVAVSVLTFHLSAHRDLGAGLLPQHGGRRQASRWLQGPFSLIARLERTSTLVWLLGLFILGAAYGSIFGTAGDLVTSNPAMAQLIGTAATKVANRTLILQFANKLTIIFVILATIPGLITLLRLNRDDRKGYFEQLHAKATSRLRLYLSFSGFGLLSALLAFALGIAGMTVAGSAAMGHNAISLTRFMRAFWGFAPALLVTFGITACFVGLLPRWQNLAWLLPAYGFFSLYLGSLLNLPKWALRLTPYGWVNTVPVQAIQWATVGWMTTLGIGLIGLGYYGYHRRDLLTN